MNLYINMYINGLAPPDFDSSLPDQDNKAPTRPRHSMRACGKDHNDLVLCTERYSNVMGTCHQWISSSLIWFHLTFEFNTTWDNTVTWVNYAHKIIFQNSPRTRQVASPTTDPLLIHSDVDSVPCKYTGEVQSLPPTELSAGLAVECISVVLSGMGVLSGGWFLLGIGINIILATRWHLFCPRNTTHLANLHFASVCIRFVFPVQNKAWHGLHI